MRRVLLGVAALLFGLTACTSSPGAPADAGAPTGPRCIERVEPSPSAPAAASSAPALPAMALPCFSGGRYTNIADLGGRPTVVNLWASWCTPCRAELPEMNRFAADGAGQVRVVGVVTKDRHDQAQSVIDELKLTFPMLEDQRQQLAVSVSPVVSKALVSLPATLFITPSGRIAYAYQGEPLTEARLRDLTRQYLGVSV
ncbi:MAG TPA: TlpA disulfide reductase family protein [Dactylosporangium sp.]|jgi:cytochrome c biogenesis protein CcmG/thiol:disulfide interchange protein DsbE|nr:TlpA disulfide reductase family protein [Dactylosporangium sp.]